MWHCFVSKIHDFWALQSLLELSISLLSLSPSPLTPSLPTQALLPTLSLHLSNFHYFFHNHKHQWYSTTNDASSTTYVANSIATTIPMSIFTFSSPALSTLSTNLHHHVHHSLPLRPALAFHCSTLAITPTIIIVSTTVLSRLLWFPLSSNPNCLTGTSGNIAIESFSS